MKGERRTDEATRPRGVSAVALVFCLWAVLLPTAIAWRLLNTDGDLGTHIRLGERVLTDGVVFRHDWSFTKPGGEFIAFEWLSEAIFYLVHSWAGLPGILVLSTLAIAGSLTIVASVLRRRLSPIILIPAIFLIAFLSATHWAARPHLVSFLGLALLFALLTCAPRPWHLAVLAVLFALWANLHPGFLYGLVMLGAFMAGRFLEERTLQAFVWAALTCGTAFAASFLHPLGWGLHLHIFEVLADRPAYDMIDEFRRTTPFSLGGFAFLATLAVSLALMIAARRLPRPSTLLVFAAAAFAALSSERNIALFAMFSLPLFLFDYASTLAALRPRNLAETGRRMEADDEAGRTWLPIGIATAVLLVLAATGGRIGPLQVLTDQFSPGRFPVEAVRVAKAEGLERHRFFHDYAWGGYFLAAWPEQKIYIDGQSNYFGSDLLAEYMSIINAEPGWETALDARGIDAILVPRVSSLAAAAHDNDAWDLVHDDALAVMLLRR